MLSKLTPHFTHKIWGGTKLSLIKKHTASSEEPLGETWEVSTHKDGSSVLGDKPLRELCELSYLVKFIDTSDNLSVQVHPGDEYAKLHENSLGKTECWIILDADPGCGIYLGFKEGITKKEFKTAIENGLDVQNYLNFFEVKPGDFFYVPFGAVHAIGNGVTLSEVQQSSGITYRVWDWNRVDSEGNSRELHINKAMDVLNFKSDFNNEIAKSKNLFNDQKVQSVVEHKDFKAEMITCKPLESLELTLNEKESIVLLDGKLKIDGEEYTKFECGFMLKSGMIKIDSIEATRFLVVKE